MNAETKITTYKEVLTGILFSQTSNANENRADLFEERPEPLFLLEPAEKKHYSKSYFLRGLLQKKDIVNRTGGFKADNTSHKNLTEIQEAFFKFCNERVKEYIKIPRAWIVPAIGWEISYTLEELLIFLKQEKPDTYFEITEEQLLSLIGIDGFEFFFKQWGVNLKEALGEYEYELLKNELNKPPICTHIQGYVQSPSKKLTAQLHFEVLKFFSKKFPLPNKDFSQPDQHLENDDQQVLKVIKVMHSLKYGQYQEWLTLDFVKNNNLLSLIVANAFVDKRSPSRKLVKKRHNAIDNIAIEGGEGTTFKFIFSHQVPHKKLRHGTDNMRFPVFADYSPEVASSCFPHIAQGIIDKASRQKSLLHQLEICESDFKKTMHGFIKGETCLELGRREAVSDYILSKARKKTKQGKTCFGQYIYNAWKKAVEEDPIIKENKEHAALAMTLTACWLLSNAVEPEELQFLLKSMKLSWKGLKTDSSSFSLIAKAIDADVPVQVILAVCELSAYPLLGKHEAALDNRAWVDKMGMESFTRSGNSEEEVLKLSLMANTAPLYLTLPINPSRALAEIQKSISICAAHKELLPALCDSIQEDTLSERIASPIKGSKIPQFESLFPTFVQNACSLFENSSLSSAGRKGLLQQSSAFIIANFTRLSEKERGAFFAFSNHIEMTPCTDQDLISLLQLMASSQIPVLNRAAYFQFKTLKSKQNQIDVARSLSEGGDVISTAKAFHILSKAFSVLTKEKKAEEDDLNTILEKICDFNGRISNQMMLQAIDIVAIGVERLCENIKLSLSIKHRHWLSSKLRLRGHLKIAEKVLPSPSKEEGKGMEKVQENKEIPLQMENTSHRETHKENLTLSKRELFKLAESGNKNMFYKFESYIREGKIPEELIQNPESLWSDLFTPLLEKALKSSHEEAELLVKACIPYLKSHTPSWKPHISFVEVIIKLCERMGSAQSFKKPLRLALSENESTLFSALFASGNYQLALKLADGLRHNNISLNQTTLRHLFLSFPDVLATSDPKARKQIFALFNGITSEELSGIDQADVLKTCCMLTLAYVKERFDISLELFKRFPEAITDDEELLMKLLDHIPSHSMRKYEQFMTLSQPIKDPSADVTICWNKVFSRLFLRIDSSMDIHTLEALEKILENPSLLQMINVENRNLTVSKILKANPHSKRFAQCLSDAFILIQKEVEENNVVEFCKKLSFSKDIKLIENGFAFIAKFSFTSPTHCQDCWLHMMEALLKGRSNKFKEIVINHQKQFLSIFNPNEKNHAKAYELLLKGTSHVLRKRFAASTFDDLIKIVHQFKPLKDEKELLALDDSFLLPYAECLSMSANIKTKNRGGNLLKQMIEKNFSSGKGKWDPFIKGFKTIIAHQDAKAPENIRLLSKLLIDYPHPELSFRLAQKLYRMSPDEHLLLIGKLLIDSLSDYASVFSMVSKGNLKKENWIEEVLNDMALHPRTSVTKIAFECIQKPLIGLVIPQKKLINLKEQILLSYLKNADRESLILKEMTEKLLNFAIKIKDQIKNKREVQRLLNKLYCKNLAEAKANRCVPIQIFMKNEGKFSEIEDMLVYYASINKAPQDCIFDYSMYIEMLKFGLENPLIQAYYQSLIEIALKLLDRNDLNSPEHFYTLIYASYYLKNIPVYYQGLYQFSETYLKLINHTIPEKVCHLLKASEFEDDHLSALKHIFLIAFDSQDEKNAPFDPIEYRTKLYALMEGDNNCLNFMIINSSLGKVCTLPGFSITNKARLDLYEMLFEYIGRLDGDSQGQYYFRVSEDFSFTMKIFIVEKRLVGLLKSTATKSLNYVIQFLNNKSHSFTQTKVLVTAFPRIVQNMFANDLSSFKNKLFDDKKLDECYQVYKLKVEEWLQMEAINANNIEFANDSIYSFIQMMPNKQRASLLNDWMKALIKIGESTRRQREFVARGRSLFEKAKKDGVYSKEQKLYSEASQIFGNLKPGNKKK